MNVPGHNPGRTKQPTKKFEVAFRSGIQGCNTCHIGQGFPYIKYQLPKAPLAPLSMKP